MVRRESAGRSPPARVPPPWRGAVVLLLLAGALFLAWRRVGREPVRPCVAAELVRVRLHGIQLQVPAELRPSFSPEEAVRTEVVKGAPGERNDQVYCQAASDPAAVTTGLALSIGDLSDYAARRPERFARLSNLVVLFVREPGEFKRPVPRSETDRLGPPLFGVETVVRCHELPDRRDVWGAGCRVTARGPNGEYVGFDILNRRLPEAEWPKLFREIEALYTSFIRASSTNSAG